MRLLKLALCLAALCFALPAAAATLCVDAGGAAPCYTHIADAVAAAAPGDVIQVNAGTYHESITIRKSISVVTQNAVLDASGLSRGFFVDGLSAPGLSGVNLSGFAIRNAQLEGVLVANASAVTVSNNVVTGNNKALSGGTCPPLEAFETNEQSDCGEGIHLLGADHSIVTNNVVEGNSGGILISDDTGATHDNLISFNDVHNNAYACGITLASHVPATLGTTLATTGVYHNTVYGNRAKANGLANGGGSGVGIFASAPGTQSYSNVVVDNYVAENGLPGIAMHAHAPNQVLNDNMIVGNTVENNAADTEDAATPGPTGINLYSLFPATGNIISGNHIGNEAVAVAVHIAIPTPAATPVQVQFNTLGAGTGLANLGITPVNATENWWSCPSGPTAPGGCSQVVGPNTSASPWLSVPVPGQPSF